MLDIRDPDDGRAVLVDLVCDETPMLVQSVLAGVGRVGRRIRRVIHAPVVVRRGSDGELAEVLPAVAPADRPSDALVEVWMRLELDPVPGEEGEDLGTELREVLAAVRDVAADELARSPTAVHAVAAELAGNAVAERQDAAEPAAAGWPTAGSPSSGTGVPAADLRAGTGSGSCAAGGPANGHVLGPGVDRPLVVVTRADAPSLVLRPDRPSRS